MHQNFQIQIYLRHLHVPTTNFHIDKVDLKDSIALKYSFAFFPANFLFIHFSNFSKLMFLFLTLLFPFASHESPQSESARYIIPSGFFHLIHFELYPGYYIS